MQCLRRSPAGIGDLNQGVEVQRAVARDYYRPYKGLSDGSLSSCSHHCAAENLFPEKGPLIAPCFSSLLCAACWGRRVTAKAIGLEAVERGCASMFISSLCSPLSFRLQEIGGEKIVVKACHKSARLGFDFKTQFRQAFQSWHKQLPWLQAAANLAGAASEPSMTAKGLDDA